MWYFNIWRLINTRMHSSRMRTVRCSDRREGGGGGGGEGWRWHVSQHALHRGCVYPSMHWAGGVYPSMHWAGGCLARGVSAWGGCLLGGVVCWGGCLLGVSATPPLWTEWLIHVKTLPFRNYVADGNNINRLTSYYLECVASRWYQIEGVRATEIEQ